MRNMEKYQLAKQKCKDEESYQNWCRAEIRKSNLRMKSFEQVQLDCIECVGEHSDCIRA